MSREYIDFFGFTVYDADDGHEVEASNLLSFKVKWARFELSSDGDLVIIFSDKWDEFGVRSVPKIGKYLIQFGDAKYMTW